MPCSEPASNSPPSTALKHYFWLPTSRPSVRHTVRSRGALQVHNATLWSLASKGKEIELTDTVGKKSICGVGGEGSDQDKSLPGIEGIHVEFVASGESDPTDSPSDLAIKNVNSEKSVTVDGEKLENGKEKKLGIGMKILFGDDTEYQVLRNVRTHA
ncbi:hypothetical protein WJX82_002041 [Trebouxia sp. C0006]